MLQQTQADRVVGYYHAFLDRFATPTDCARAGAAEVVRLWSGLGYNRRALNLHRAALVIAEEYGGRVPDDEQALRALPGVGPYTARAVLSFAFEADVAVVDTNVLRVLARCVAGSGLTLPGAQSLADRLLPAGRSWAFNQAMFDLGATVCTPRPACERCPMRRQCRWALRRHADADPWRASPSVRPQAPFAGSDRQGRGRLVHALRQGAVSRPALAAACGWPDDPERAERITDSLVAEGFAEWAPGRPPRLRLC
jgi:A/G-specific adenine glycosylase